MPRVPRSPTMRASGSSTSGSIVHTKSLRERRRPDKQSHARDGIVNLRLQQPEPRAELVSDVRRESEVCPRQLSAASASSRATREEVLARQEKAAQGHHALVGALHAALTVAGW